jgi:hypothetical protein
MFLNRKGQSAPFDIIEPVERIAKLSQKSLRSIAWAAGVGLGVGALTVLGQATLPGSWNHFANSGAVWLVAAFVVGAWMPSVPWAMVSGFISLLMALAGYTAVISVLGLTYPFSASAFWGAVGLAGGPAFGLAGQWWHHSGGSWRHAISAALMGGVFIAEGWYMLTIIQDPLAGWVSVLIGGLLAILLPRSWKDRFRCLAALIPIVLLGIGVFTWLSRLAA